jgi:GT2 family glycosyltransferase
MLSLITIARDRRENLGHLLRAAARLRPRPLEVVVVDMGGAPVATDVDVPVIVTEFGTHAEQLPLAAARNHGAAVANGSDLLFLDVDCLPGVDLTGEMAGALRRRGGLVMANVQYLPDGFVDDGDEGRRLAAGAPHPVQSDLDRDVPPELFWSTAFGVHRSDFDALGGFCEEYRGYGGEDTDLGFVAADAGVPISRWRTALAYHQWHPSPDPPLQHLHDIVRNARLFHSRWGRWAMAGWLEAFDELGVLDWDRAGGRLELADRVVA